MGDLFESIMSSASPAWNWCFNPSENSTFMLGSWLPQGHLSATPASNPYPHPTEYPVYPQPDPAEADKDGWVPYVPPHARSYPGDVYFNADSDSWDEDPTGALHVDVEIINWDGKDDQEVFSSCSSPEQTEEPFEGNNTPHSNSIPDPPPPPLAMRKSHSGSSIGESSSGHSSRLGRSSQRRGGGGNGRGGRLNQFVRKLMNIHANEKNDDDLIVLSDVETARTPENLERFPNKIQNNGVAPNANAHPLTGAVVTKSATAAKRNQTQNAADTEDSRYLLSCLDEPNLTDTEKEKRSNEDNDRAQFVQELLLSLLSTDQDEPDQEDVTIQPLMPAPTPGRFSMERATPVECPLLSSTPTHADSAPTVADSPVTSLNQSNNHNDDTGVGNSMLTDNTNSPPGAVVSSSDHCQNAVAPAPADAGAVSSRSAPVLPTGAGDRKWRYRDADEKESDDDSDKPPSPTPMDQHRALTMQGRVLVAGGSPLGRLHRGGAINEYNRDEMATGGLSKHVH